MCYANRKCIRSPYCRPLQREPKVTAPMLYEMFQAQDDIAGPARAMARLVAGWIGHAPPWVQESFSGRSLSAGLDVFASAGVIHSRPPFAIDLGADRQPHGRDHRACRAEPAVR